MVGNGIFKNFRYSEGNLKTFNIQKVEPQNYLCHAWVSEERVIVGTDTGRLMLFEAGEMKHEFNIAAMEKDKYVMFFMPKNVLKSGFEYDYTVFDDIRKC